MPPFDHRLLDDLEALALLGEGRTRAGELVAQLAPEIIGGNDPTAQLRLLTRAAELAEATETLDAVPRLTEVRDLWGVAGILPLAMALHLRALRVLARRGNPVEARARFEEVADVASQTPEVAADLALARAEVDPMARRSALEAALTLLPSPARDHDRLVALLDLAELHRGGGDLVRATVLLESALSLARRHEDAPARSTISALLADLLVARGLAHQAEPLLEEAVSLAELRGDDLGLIARGLTLGAVLIARGDWEGVIRLSRRVALAARARGNWLAVAAASIDTGAALQGLGAHQQAIDVLVDSYHRLAAMGARGAANLIRARLAEIRIALGSATFDAALAAAVERRKPPDC